MLETILERVNALAESMERGLNALREEVGSLRGEFNAFRDETKLNFQRIEKQINILNNNLLKAQANQELFEDRLDALESRVS